MKVSWRITRIFGIDICIDASWLIIFGLFTWILASHYFPNAAMMATWGLKEKAAFLEGEALKPEEEERYGQYENTHEVYTLYEHCRRAIKKSSITGPHGLPLIGTGDWNDGMNRVGVEGRGESIWLGWFLYATLTNFASICEVMDDVEQAALYRQQASDLLQALEANGWDGNWYLRAYYDDGTPLGSADNQECQIDSIAQSWAVLSGAGDPARVAQAMDAVVERLVRPDDQLALLFTPPFDTTPHDPGYIKGYRPGIRENGGQYTHAALWTVWALAELEQGDRVESLFRLLNPIYHSDTPEKASRYRVENPDGVNRGVRQAMLDGKTLREGMIPLAEDGRKHQVYVRMG